MFLDYHILNRLGLCKCSLIAGNYLLSQTATNCGDMPEARDGYFTTYYAFNKVILDVITVKLDIQVDDKTIAQSTLLHDDIPGYNLLTLEFMLPPVDDDKDLILKEENPEIYAHLENILVHMIDAQDVAIFKSQKERNKQKLLEYIHYAQMWQVLFGHILLCSLYMRHFTCVNTDHILHKIPKDNASYVYGIYNYCHICYFESKDIPTQMTKQSFTIIYFITFKKTIHFKLICKNVHS